MVINNLVGLMLIAFIIWRFWLYKPPKAIDMSIKNLTVVVNDGVYQPSRIKISAGKQTTLKFLRKDQSLCVVA